MRSNECVRTIVFRTLLRKKIISLGVIFAIVGCIITALFPPLILGNIVDALAGGQSISINLAVLYFLLIALAGLFESLRESVLTMLGQKITHALRSRLMDKMTRLNTDALSHTEPGELVSRFVGDVDTVEKLFTGGIISMFSDACSIIGILAVIWTRNRGLTLILIMILPFIYRFTRYVQKNMLASQLENRRAVSRVSGQVPETLHNIRTIHTLHREGYMAARYNASLEDSYRAIEKTNFYDAIYSPVILIINAVVVAVVMLLSASGNAGVLTLFSMSAGTAVAVMNYIAQIFAPVESLGMEIQTIQSSLAGVRRINSFLGQEEIEPRKSVSPASDGRENKPLIELRDVVFGYGERAVLNRLSFCVQQGERVTLSGRTGAGKSTIFKLLPGLYRPQSGRVLIDGCDAADIPPDRRRALFGYVEQNFHLVPGTIRDQITLYDVSIDDASVNSAIATVGLSGAIAALPDGLDTLCVPELFSQGQWQLLSIARAAVTNPDILLLDEITANLDAETEKAVLKALKRVSEYRTVISISHRVGAREGRIIEIESSK